MVSLQVPAVKLYYKLLSVLPQDRLLDPDVVKLYLVLFSSLISKPDLFQPTETPFFIVSRIRKYVEGMVQTSAQTPGQVFPRYGGNGSRILPMLRWELWGKFRGKLSLWKMEFLSFLGFRSMCPPPPDTLIGPVKEESTLLYVRSLPSPSFHGCPLGTSQYFPLQSTWQHGTWIDSNPWISLPETLGCHGVPQLIS